MKFVIFADYCQVVLLDGGVNLNDVHNPPLWSIEDPEVTKFSSRANAQAVAVGGIAKQDILLEVEVLEGVPAASVGDWVHVFEFILNLPSGTLGIAEILSLEYPTRTLKVAPGTYRVRASIGADSVPVVVPPESMPPGVESVNQRVMLELWPENTV